MMKLLMRKLMLDAQVLRSGGAASEEVDRGEDDVAEIK